MPASLTVNGKRTFDPEGALNLVEGAVVTYTCDSNYQLSLAQNTFSCTSEGNWDPPIGTPICHPGKPVV